MRHDSDGDDEGLGRKIGDDGDRLEGSAMVMMIVVMIMMRKMVID